MTQLFQKHPVGFRYFMIIHNPSEASHKAMNQLTITYLGAASCILQVMTGRYPHTVSLQASGYVLVPYGENTK